ncbi:unnamed protein product [Closterium sp. NIES-65]|nr:unnamed protein product [Closterium sp. NIES-65]
MSLSLLLPLRLLSLSRVALSSPVFRILRFTLQPIARPSALSHIGSILPYCPSLSGPADAVIPSTSLPQVALKWPNDIFLGGLKVGGVLCTSSYRNRAFDVTVGIGLNVNNAHPTTCINAALQAACPSAAPVSHEALLAALLNRLHSLLSVFEQQGFKPLEADYLQRWLHSGQHVVLEEAKEGGSVTQVSLTIQGLTTGGYLLATDPSGIQYELSPDGNSLDFFKGLMRRKLNPEEQVAGGH